MKSDGGSGKLGIRKDMNWVNESKKLILGPHNGSLFLTQLRMDCQVQLPYNYDLVVESSTHNGL